MLKHYVRSLINAAFTFLLFQLEAIIRLDIHGAMYN